MPFSRDFPAVADSLVTIRGDVDAFARKAGASSRLAACIVQAVNEAAVNAIIHGYGGGDPDRTVAVAGKNGDGWLRFTIADRGHGFRPSRTSPGYGLGLAIIAQLADELEIRDGEGGGMTVLVAFRLRD